MMLAHSSHFMPKPISLMLGRHGATCRRWR
ncbi:Uncharacterised protein [Vibrio cholerae]|nr:Uncharacterised protein [Vibrio cholerae]CSI75601.1 Uncharacterised protein [Vibrio cholerae]